jgi:peptidoglycan/LPS O-acetylase OafA/YrhL
MPESIRSGPAPKLLGLEILRFVAAVAVLFWHYQNFWWAGDGLAGFVRGDQPLYALFGLFYEYGLYGVQIFWGISGYIFFWKYRGTISAGRVSGHDFFLLRFSRLYPLHFLTLVLVAVLQWWFTRSTGHAFVYHSSDVHHFLLQLFMASGWGFQAGASFNGPIWSISIEVLIYALFFVAVRACGAGIAIPVVISVLGVVAHAFSNRNPIFQCMVCFFVGGTLACIVRTERARSNRLLVRNLVLVSLILVPLFGQVMHAFESRAAVQAVAMGCVAASIYLAAEHVTIPGRFVRSVEAAGNMTYSSYLIHFPVQLGIALVCARQGWIIPRGSVLFLLAFMVSVLAFAALIHRYVEIPAQKMIRHNTIGRHRIVADMAIQSG